MAAAYIELAFAPPFHTPAENVWASIARCYAAFDSPLVPCRADIRAFEQAAVVANTGRTDGLKAVMLGVTPGIALMNWPPGATITAVDMSPAVIDALWPGDIPGSRRAICATWLSIPVEPASCDLVLGDGSLIACRFPSEMRTLARAVSDLLNDKGVFAVRSYIHPQQAESVDEVFQALFTKGLRVDAFKMRLWMAMQHCAEEGVAVRDAAQILREYGLDSRVMQDRLGWSLEAVQPFEDWPTSDAVYTFPALDELRAVMAECFDEVSITWPAYELGRCCPVMVMRKK